MVLKDVGDVIGDYSGLSRKVLDYAQLMKRMVDDAKQPGFGIDSWAPLTAMVAVDEFERVGNFKEVMGWNDYIEFLTRWAPNAEWECSFKRITEHGNMVFLELEERSKFAGRSNAVNSMSIYDFNEAGKLRHLDIYLQMELPKEAMPQFYG